MLNFKSYFQNIFLNLKSTLKPLILVLQHPLKNVLMVFYSKFKNVLYFFFKKLASATPKKDTTSPSLNSKVIWFRFLSFEKKNTLDNTKKASLIVMKSTTIDTSIRSTFESFYAPFACLSFYPCVAHVSRWLNNSNTVKYNQIINL